jgi:hypothetical protein
VLVAVHYSAFGKALLPITTRYWLALSKPHSYYADTYAYMPVPAPDKDKTHRILEWDMEPGDAVAFTLEPCTAREAIIPQGAGMHFHYGYLRMTHAIYLVQGPLISLSLTTK